MFTFNDTKYSVQEEYHDIKDKNLSFFGFSRCKDNGKLSDIYHIMWDDHDGGTYGLFEGNIEYVKKFLSAMRNCEAWEETLTGEAGYIWFETGDNKISVFTDCDGGMFAYEDYTVEEWHHIVDEMEKAVEYLTNLKD